MSGTYLGVVANSNNFFNFEPRNEIVNGNIVDFRNSELYRKLVADSEKQNVNFSYNRNDDFIPDLFFDKGLFIFDYDQEDLIDNGTNITRYKIDARKLYEERKIRHIEDDGFYYVITNREEGNVVADGDRFELNDPIATEGRKVLIELKEYGILAGPYEVQIRELDNKPYVRNKAKENKYLISGYSGDNHRIFSVRSAHSYEDGIEFFPIVKITDQDEMVSVDTITDEQIIEHFKNTIVQLANEEPSDLHEIRNLIEQYKDTLFVGDNISEEIRRNRLQRLTELVVPAETVEDTLNEIGSKLGDVMADILTQFKNTNGVERFVDELLNQNKGLLENLGSIKPINERKANIEKETEDLVEQKKSLESDISRLQSLKDDKQEAVEQSAEKLSKEVELQKQEKQALEEETQRLRDNLDLTKKYVELKEENDYLVRSNDRERQRHEELKDETKQLEASFAGKLSDYSKQMYEITFDGFLSNKILEASAQWEQEKDRLSFDSLCKELEEIPVVDKDPDELIDYLCNAIRTVRPGYSRNNIINLATCFTQGFLTVLWGKPGCGKTSISNIFAQALGLERIKEYVSDNIEVDPSRFVPVSVERGWTSKRDFIGYFNPLTKTFDKNNRQVYDALKVLDIEQRSGMKKLPFMILLDEANLSSMEYYWADFMNICDDLNQNSSVNLGGDNVFRIPETLHFLATINHDLTTEVLSPRLIDRAWIITLPKVKTFSGGSEIPRESTEIVSWESMWNAFGTTESKKKTITSTVNQSYDKIVKHFEKKHIYISPRTEKAVKDYCRVTADLFENDPTGADASIVALDYAVSQKILPKIKGVGEEFKEWLIELRQLCSADSLYESSDIIREIIAHGESEMSYFEFFR